MRKHTEKGFAIGIILIGVVVIGLAGWLGYRFLTNAKHTTPQAVPHAQASLPGTTAGIDSLMTNEINSEASIDASHVMSDQAAAQNTNQAAANVGGAYDESSF